MTIKAEAHPVIHFAGSGHPGKTGTIKPAAAWMDTQFLKHGIHRLLQKMDSRNQARPADLMVNATAESQQKKPAEYRKLARQ